VSESDSTKESTYSTNESVEAVIVSNGYESKYTLERLW